MALNEISKRLIQVYENLVEQGKVKDVPDFGRQLKITPQVFYNIQRDKQNASVGFIQKVVDVFKVSADWLFAERGSMYYPESLVNPVDLSGLEKDMTLSVEEMKAHYERAGAMTIRLVTAKLYGKYAKECSNDEWLRGLPSAKMPMIAHPAVRGFEIGDDALALANGRGLHEGYWVFCTRAEMGSESVRSGRVHVVVTESSLHIRRVYADNKKYELRADNGDYKSLWLKESDICELWYAHSFWGYNMNPPDEAEAGVKKLTEEIAGLLRWRDEIEAKLKDMRRNH